MRIREIVNMYVCCDYNVLYKFKILALFLLESIAIQLYYK